MSTPRGRASKRAARFLLAASMITTGVLHFTEAAVFEAMIPAPLAGWALELVYLSGVFEILGGVGILPRRTRRFAGWGLIALYVAVFPANVNMAIHELPLGGDPVPVWALWARLPVQLVFIAWAWWVAAARNAAAHELT